MNLVRDSFEGLFPDREFNYSYKIKYSGKFNPYNARVKLQGRHLEFRLSKEWEKINPEIKMGLIQSLMMRLFRVKKQTTTNIDFYNNFIKKIHLITPKTKNDDFLEASFDRVNQRYFDGLLERPNLVWGRESIRKLGSYDLQSDTISISAIFKGESGLLDYVMYHELLHKKHQFYHKNGRNYFHTPKFKKEERIFEAAEEKEEELKKFLRKRKRNHFLRKIYKRF